MGPRADLDGCGKSRPVLRTIVLCVCVCVCVCHVDTRLAMRTDNVSVVVVKRELRQQIHYNHNWKRNKYI
jgi:hypothetical protein